MSATVTPIIRPATAPVTGVERPSRYVLLTVKEAAEKLGKSEAQLRWMVHIQSAPPSAMIGGRRMFRLSDIEDYIDAAFAVAGSTAF